MAKVQIMYWKDIPYAVRATDDTGRASRQLPREFEAVVDAAAMAEGATEQPAYKAGFRWGPEEERSGGAAEVAEALLAEVIAAYPAGRLAKLAKRQPA
ncbi:MAG: virulence factor [Chloroflexi bacterium]|nr:virulence factor [Chloroflexota bacterium]